MLNMVKPKVLTGDQVMGLNRLVAGVGTLVAFRYLGEPHMFSAWWPSVSVWLTWAVVILFTVGRSPRHIKLIRSLALLLDTAGTTLIMGAGSSDTAYAFVAYLWVIIGYGFRFGLSWLVAASLLSICGFAFVLANDDFWWFHKSLSFGLLSALAVLPVYSFALIRRLQQARAEAERANIAKSLFLAGVSHELRTPLHAIIGTVEGLQETRLSFEQMGLVATINGAAVGQLSLVQDLLEYSRLDAGDERRVQVPIDLCGLLEDVTAVAEAAARGTNLHLNYHVTARTPLAYIGDRRRIREVLLNLCSNAIRYTKAGSVTIAVDRVSIEGSTAQLRFEVADTGIGIHPEDHQRIFELFTQALGDGVNGQGGTGLGLALCKRLVGIMDGKIGVESAPGIGSTFWFTVPLEHSAEPDAPVAPLVALAPPGSPDWVLSIAGELNRGRSDERLRPEVALIFDAQPLGRSQQPKAAIYVSQSASGIPPTWARVPCVTTLCTDSSPVEFARALHIASAWVQRRQSQVSGIANQSVPAAPTTELKGIKVLVADDNKINRSILQRMLDKAGAEVVMACDGEQALNLLTVGDVDIALLDVQMPLMDGIEVAQFYAFTVPVRAQIPLLALTADGSPETEARCLRVGFKRCLVKPVKPSDLLLILADELAGSTAPPIQLIVPPNISAPALDLGTYRSLEALIGIPGMIELIDGFKQDGEPTVDRIALALSEGNLTSFRFESHALGSMAGNMGGRGLAAVCSTWSRMSESEFAQAPRIVPPQLRWEWERTCRALDEQTLAQPQARRSVG